MRSIKGVLVVLALGAALAFAVSACGSDSTTTVTEQSGPPTTTTGSTTTGSTTTGSTTTASTTTTGSTTTAAGPGSCSSNQAFSQVSKTCVDLNPSGNPCPEGQVPMADRPVCVSKDE